MIWGFLFSWDCIGRIGVGVFLVIGMAVYVRGFMVLCNVSYILMYGTPSWTKQRSRSSLHHCDIET